MVSLLWLTALELPAVNAIKEMREPIVLASVLVPQEYLGNVINLALKSVVCRRTCSSSVNRCR